MKEQDWALGVGLWGAVLSTSLGIRQILRDRPGIKVLITRLFDLRPDTDVQDLWEVRVANVRGPLPIQVRSVGLVVNDGAMTNHFIPLPVRVGGKSPDPLPVTINPGHVRSFYFARDDHAEAMRVTGAFVQDMLDRTYQGRVRAWNPGAVIHRVQLNRKLRRMRLPKSR